MTRVESILKLYREGKLPATWAESEIAEEITPDNVDAVMALLPPDLVESLSRWKVDGPIMVIGSSMTPEEEKRIRARLAVAIPALRDWFARQAAHPVAPITTPAAPHESVNP